MIVKGFEFSQEERRDSWPFIHREWDPIFCYLGWKKLLGSDILPEKFGIRITRKPHKGAKELFIYRSSTGGYFVAGKEGKVFGIALRDAIRIFKGLKFTLEHEPIWVSVIPES